MKMIRFIIHCLVFVVGIGLGIVWGVHHPSEAADIARREQIASSKAKIELLTKLGTAVPNGQQMIDDEQKKLADAEQQPAGN
jgi:hypothetical protein